MLIVTPWNYPLNLTLVPLVGAIAAGERGSSTFPVPDLSHTEPGRKLAPGVLVAHGPHLGLCSFWSRLTSRMNSLSESR